MATQQFINSDLFYSSPKEIFKNFSQIKNPSDNECRFALTKCPEKSIIALFKLIKFRSQEMYIIAFNRCDPKQIPQLFNSLKNPTQFARNYALNRCDPNYLDVLLNFFWPVSDDEMKAFLRKSNNKRTFQ